MRKKFLTMRPEFQGLALILMAYLCFAMLNVLSKQLYSANHIDPFIITFYRSLFCILMISPFAARVMYRERRVFFDKVNLYKGVTDFLSIPAWVMAVAHVNIPEAVGLTYLTPIMTATLASIFLRDHLTWHKCLVMAIGTIGAYIILHPQSENFNFYTLYALAACLCWSIGNVLTKNLSNTQSPSIIVLASNIVILVLASPLFFLNPYYLNTSELILCIAMSTSAMGGQFFLAAACRCTKLSNLVPYDYFRLIFATLFAYIFFGQLIDISTIVGALFILVGSIYLVRSQISSTTVSGQIVRGSAIK